MKSLKEQLADLDNDLVELDAELALLSKIPNDSELIAYENRLNILVQKRLQIQKLIYN